MDNGGWCGGDTRWRATQNHCGPRGSLHAAERRPASGAAIAYCYGFAEGAVDIVLSYSAAGPQSHRPFCLPSPAPKLSQVVGDFVAWANNDAAISQKPAVVGLARYLTEHFPCPNASAGSRGGKR